MRHADRRRMYDIWEWQLGTSVETESDSGSADSDQIPLFQGFEIDSNLFFKI